MKAKRWGFMALAVALALTMLWGCQALIKPEEPEARSYNTACYQEQGGARWVCGSGGEFAVLDGGTLDVAGDADFTGATVTGFSPSSLDSNVTVTGNLVVSGTTTSVGAITGDVTGDLTGDVTGNVTGDVTGTLTGNVTGDVTGDLTGDVTGNVSGATYVTATTLYGDLVGSISGYAMSQRPVAYTSDYTLTAAASGVIAMNLGATGEVTFTLPEATAATSGYYYCFYVHEAYTVTIKPGTSDQIHALTNAPDDRIQNTGTAGNSVCLVNVSDVYWIPLQEIGTWSDIN